MGTLTSKCQVTIPKRVRESLGLGPGSRVDFDVDEQGRIFLRKTGSPGQSPRRGHDRFESARGRATVRMRTEEVMRLLRPED